MTAFFTAAGELNPLMPHPIELALAFHVVVALAIWITALVMASRGRISWLPTFAAAWVLLFLPLLGLPAAVVLLVLSPREVELVAEVCPACGRSWHRFTRRPLGAIGQFTRRSRSVPTSSSARPATT